MSSEQFNLAWKEFENSTSRSFRNLYLDQDFTDVTLATKDGKQIKAHRNILSSISPLLKTILLANPHQHPLLYFKGVKNNSLQSIMKFIYLGQAEVYQENLEDFMNAADDLEIAGLCKSNTKETVLENRDSVSKDLMNESFLKTESPSLETHCYEEESPVSPDMMEMVSDEDDKNEFSLNSTGPGFYQCKQCEFTSKDKSNLKKHIDYKHEGIRYACGQCEYKATTTSHLKRIHGL